MKDVFQADFGASLKAAREAKKLTAADVAVKLKLTARQVEALELEEFEQLPVKYSCADLSGIMLVWSDLIRKA